MEIKTTTKKNPNLGKAVVRRCTCRHTYQDKVHGLFMRVHNVCNIKATGKLGARCTICLVVKE